MGLWPGWRLGAAEASLRLDTNAQLVTRKKKSEKDIKKGPKYKKHHIDTYNKKMNKYGRQYLHTQGKLYI